MVTTAVGCVAFRKVESDPTFRIVTDDIDQSAVAVAFVYSNARNDAAM